jgi:hypothetical protein
MSRFELRVPPERLSAWQAAAAEAGLSLSEWVRLLAEAELGRNRQAAAVREERSRVQAEIRGLR